MSKSYRQEPTIRLVQNEDARETFIPLRHDDLIRLLLENVDWEEAERIQFGQLCDRLHSVFHAEHLSTLLAVETIYSPLDPDCELVKTTAVSEELLDRRTGRLFECLCELLESAHYQRISRDELLEAIQLSSQWGIKLGLDFDVFDQLEVYARGYRMVEVQRRRWQTLYRKETLELPEFHRLVIAFRVKDDLGDQQLLKKESIYLKMFKNIPETELEILLPGTKIKLSPLDHGKILFPTISGAAPTIYKIYRGAIVIGLGLSLVNIWSTIIVFAAFAGYVLKSVLTYFRTKDKYQFELTKNLYVKNLDNNAGVLYRVINEAREQELCETILSYALLVKNSNGGNGLSSEELDRLAEAFIDQHTGADINFEVDDAVAKLKRLGLARPCGPAGEFWEATDLERVSGALNDNWISLFHERLNVLTAGRKGDEDFDENLFTSS